MTHSEMLKFANVINDGMEKEAGTKRLLQAGAAGLGRLFGRSANAAESGANLAGSAAKGTWNFLNKERHLPNTGVMDAVRSGYRDVRPSAPAPGWMAPQQYRPNPASMNFRPAPQAPAPAYAGNPQQFNFKRPAPAPTPAPAPVAAPQAAVSPAAPAPQPTVAPAQSTAAQTGGTRVTYSGSNAGTGSTYVNPSGASNTGSNGNAVKPLVAANLPPGGLKPTGRWGQVQSFWNNRSMPQKIGLGYGGVTAATMPSNFINNQKADWQQQHPFQSFFARNFAGMPEYKSRTYLMPSFIQR